MNTDIEKNYVLPKTSIQASSPINPVIVVFLGVIAVSTSAPLVKLSDTPALILAFYRMLFAFLIITPFALRSSFWLTLTSKQLLYSVGAGFFLAAHLGLWFLSLELTSIASAVVLVTLQPIFVVAGGIIIFKEYLSKKALFAGAVALCGGIIIGWGDFNVGGMALLGDLLALLGAVMIALYMLIGRLVRKNLDLIPYTWIVYGSATLFLLIAGLISKDPLGPYQPYEWTIFLLLAIIPTLLGHSLFSWSLKWVAASLVSIAILGESVGATLLGYLIFGEIPTLQQFIGGALILSGLLLFILNSDQQPADRDSYARKAGFK